MSSAEMTDNDNDLIEGYNPIADLSHHQKEQFTGDRYWGDLKSSSRNATKALRTNKFDIPKDDLNKDTLGRKESLVSFDSWGFYGVCRIDEWPISRICGRICG